VLPTDAGGVALRSLRNRDQLQDAAPAREAALWGGQAPVQRAAHRDAGLGGV